MFEKIGRAAEKAAASVPRRQFLADWVVELPCWQELGGILLTAGTAEAGGGWCCLTGTGCIRGKCRGVWGTTVRCSDYGMYCPK